MWHASVSVQDRKRRTLDRPAELERQALACLAGVGGTWERWRISPARIGHLHVPVTDAEALLIPPGLVVADAGETGPERARSPVPG